MLTSGLEPHNVSLTSEPHQAHYDYFHDQLNVQNGGQRVATVLLYLCAHRSWRRGSDAFQV